MLASSLGHELFVMPNLSHQTTFCDALGPFIYAAPHPLLTFFIASTLCMFPTRSIHLFAKGLRGKKGVRYLGVVGLY